MNLTVKKRKRFKSSYEIKVSYNMFHTKLTSTLIKSLLGHDLLDLHLEPQDKCLLLLHTHHSGHIHQNLMKMEDLEEVHLLQVSI